MIEIGKLLSKKVGQLQKTQDPLQKVLHLKTCSNSPIFLVKLRFSPQNSDFEKNSGASFLA